MIKEIVLAVTLGALLGFGITGGYLATRKNKVTRIAAPTPSIVNTTPSPTGILSASPTVIKEAETKIGDQKLIINKPADEEIVSNSLLEINGQSSPSSVIIINTSQKHYQIISDESGNFKIEVELESGINNIQIDSFDQDDVQSSTSFQVTYSTAKI